jgi:hypothetical protein
MKKYIYKIKLVVVAVLVLSSCAVDDDPAITNPVGNIEASLPSALVRIDPAATSHDLEVSLTSALPTSAQVDYNLDGVSLVARGDQGSNTITITVDMSASLFRTVSLTDIIMFYASAQNINVTVSETNNTTTIVRGTDNFAVLTWGNNTDIDLLLTTSPAPAAPYTDNPATTIDLSLLVVPQEIVTLPPTLPDGAYAVSIVPFAAFSTPIDFNLTVIAGDAAHNLTGTVDSGLAAGGGFFAPIVYNTVVEFATITKSGGSYTVVNQL